MTPEDAAMIDELTREFSAISADLLCMGIVVKYHNALPRLLALARRTLAAEAENARLRAMITRANLATPQDGGQP